MHNEQQVWAVLGNIGHMYARYVETSGKGPGVVTGVCSPRMGAAVNVGEEVQRQGRNPGTQVLDSRIHVASALMCARGPMKHGQPGS
jgi:hypothetical protein